MLFKKRYRWYKRKKKVNFQIEKPVGEFLSGSVVLQVWKKRSKKDREYYCFTVSRYQTNGRTFWHSKHLFPSDIDDIVATFHKFLGDFHRLRKF